MFAFVQQTPFFKLATTTKGTNFINASAEWEESEISRKIEQIQNIENVTILDYNKHVNTFCLNTL
jgi:hypothetical protein